MRLNYFKHFF